MIFILTLSLISAATLRATTQSQTLQQTEPALKDLIEKIKLIAAQTASESLIDMKQLSDSQQKEQSFIGISSYQYTVEDINAEEDEDN